MQKELIENPSEAAVQEIRNLLVMYNLSHIEDPACHDYMLRYADESGGLIAGMCFSIHGQWLEISFLFVNEQERTRGIGSQLLQEVEQLAWEKHCRMAALNTFGFQAKPFYEKSGYRVVYEQRNYPRTGSRYYMEKQLPD